MDKILIRQLQVDAIIGIHDWEKQHKQPILIDMDLSFDCQQAAVSDDINDALDYFEVCQQITAFVGASHFELIEKLAQSVADLVLNNFPCQKIKLTLFKPDAIANTQAVGIQIKRSQSD